jgi:hypothetical protein
VIYKGDFLKGKKTGEGRLDFGGNWYEGNFDDGHF